MPVYDYLCPYCGPFTEIVPMARFAEDMACPECTEPAPRALLAAPHFRGMDGSRFAAHEVNERAAHAPQSSARTGRHPAGCGCCRKSTGAAKTFPGTRPWMISH